MQKRSFEVNKRDEQVQIWTVVNANKSSKIYYMYQDWWWDRITTDETLRTYSFTGLYRKFCEADIFECMRLKDMIRTRKTIT